MNANVNRDSELYEMLTTSKMTSGNNWGTGIILYNPITKKILMAKRTDTKNYCTPGGKVEVGESPVKGITRETHEESNVKLNSVKFLGYRCHTSGNNNKNWVSFMFLSTDFDCSKLKNQESEVEPWEWYTVEEALTMELFEPTKVSLELAIQLGIFECENSDIVCEEVIGASGDGDTGELIFDGGELPRVCDMYLNCPRDNEPVPSYSYNDNLLWD
jgi:8-oxo-dGTP pyrophosphatase MutT (NUDIX family)